MIKKRRDPPASLPVNSKQQQQQQLFIEKTRIREKRSFLELD